MKIKYSIFLLLCALFITINSQAQNKDFKFGKVDEKDLTQKVYPKDSSATAAVLCNTGFLSSEYQTSGEEG
ncbi:MAG: hypothetical protein Q8859_13830, partial [Bacteroidota bacterium]|nr:hypothetical protein [Bacteroidota bacterium]